MDMNRQQTLQRLDQWYGNRFMRNMSPESVRIAMTPLEKMLDEDKLFPDKHKAEVKEKLRYERQRARAYQNYTEYDRVTKEFSNPNSNYNLLIARWDTGVREEYVNPLLEKIKEVELFFSAVQNAAKPAEREISEREIDTVLIKHFTTIDNYIELTKKLIEYSAQFGYLISKKSPVKLEGCVEWSVLKKYADYMQKYTEILYREMFKDLIN